MIEWEYLVEGLHTQVEGDNVELKYLKLQEHLNRRGKDGWELVEWVPIGRYVDADNRFRLLFKRPCESTSEVTGKVKQQATPTRQKSSKLKSRA